MEVERKDEKTKSRVPKLRFKEFSDEWQEKRLNKLCLINPKHKTMPSNFVYIDLESVNSGVLMKLNKISKEDAPSRAQRVLEKNDILYQMVRPYQKNNLYFNFDTCIENYIASTGYAQIRAKENSKYIYQYLHTDKFVNTVLENCTGTSYPAINSSDLGNLYIIYPSLQEQEKIATFLSSVDTKIEKLEKKKELLNDYKKGMMQKLFSQKLRFKDENGNDYPQWEEKKLGEVCECLDNKRKPLNSSERSLIMGKYPYYGANGIQGYINKFIFDETLVLLAEDGGNFGDYQTKPIAQLIKGKSWVNNHAHVLKGRTILLTEFLFYSLVHKDIRAYINGTSRSKLNKSDMLMIKLSLPSLQEQEKIANFLSAIDKKMELVERELEEHKEFKKGLLQQMFV